jgi:hypothetical protein
MFEYYERHIAVDLRTYSYFGITFFYLFWSAHALYYKRYWEHVSYLATALFFILLFIVVIVKNQDITHYILTPYLFVWAIISFIYLFGLFRQAYYDKFFDYIIYIRQFKDWIKNCFKKEL